MKADWTSRILAGVAGVCLCAGFVCFSASFSPLGGADAVHKTVQLDVNLSDPVFPDLPAQTYPVELTVDQDGFPLSYEMELKTDVCLDQVCGPLFVTLCWDAVGRYKKLETSDLYPLTKTDHVPFGFEDYQRLEEILHSRDTIIKDYPLTYFVYPPAETVDAVSSATPPAVQEAVVPGAAYTSWVLWHWVHGPIVEQLQDYTFKHTGSDFMRSCLESQDADLNRIALDRILRQEPPDPQYATLCYDLLRRTDGDTARRIMDYLQSAPIDSQSLQYALADLIGENNVSDRLIFDNFQALENPAPNLENRLAQRLEHLSDYFQIHSVLRIFEQKGWRSGPVRTAVSGLLTNQSSFVVRRAKEFLEVEK